MKGSTFPHYLQEIRPKVSSILFTKEATLTKDGVINFRNIHHWDFENAHATVESKFNLEVIVRN